MSNIFFYKEAVVKEASTANLPLLISTSTHQDGVAVLGILRDEYFMDSEKR
ncbi:MAG: hypothetical protein AABY49_10025 [Planctomycetota bacterium]